MSKLTVYLARLIGLFALLVGAACLVRGNAVVETAVADGPVMLVYAVVSLAAGLAMILGHNVWSGGTLPVVVTLVGWLILAKGLLLFFVTPEALTQLLERMQYGEHYSLYIAPSLVIGLYLTWPVSPLHLRMQTKISSRPLLPSRRDISFWPVGCATWRTSASGRSGHARWATSE